MAVDTGLEPDHEPDLGEFVLARIAEEKRAAGGAPTTGGGADVLADCSARRRLVQVCREMGPDMAFLGVRPHGMADFFLSPSNQHQLAALTLALLAVPYARHSDYRAVWRP